MNKKALSFRSLVFPLLLVVTLSPAPKLFAAAPSYTMQVLPYSTLQVNASAVLELDSGDIVFTVDEVDHFGADLNGDGDALDRGILHIRQPSGAVQNYAVDASELMALAGGRLAFTVHEGDQGGLSLNGDLDASDRVLHVWDAQTRLVTNLGVAVNSIWREFPFAAGGFVFNVQEIKQGQGDLDGDGDVDTANILHSWTPAAGIVNIRISSGISVYERLDDGALLLNQSSTLHLLQTDGQLINLATSAASTFAPLAGGGAVFSRSESLAGADLSGDGDQNDSVLFTLVRPATINNTGIVGNLGNYNDGRYTTLSDGRWLISRHESGVGQDLNGDTDLKDGVVNIYDPATGIFLNSGLAGSGAAKQLPTGGSTIVVDVSECAQGNLDLDNDGNGHIGEVCTFAVGNDFVAHVWDFVANTVINLQRDEFVAYPAGAGRVALTIKEDGDQNGDGDSGDSFLYVWTSAAGLVNLNLQTYYAAKLEGGRLLFDVREANTLGTGTDLNGDGDKLDSVAHVLSAVDNSVRNLNVSRDGWFVLRGGRFLVRTLESRQGNTNYNGDGNIGVDNANFLFTPSVVPPGC